MKRNTLLSLTVLGLSLTVFVSHSLAIRHERLVDAWRPLHYSVELTLDDKLTELVKARTQIEIVAIKRLSVVDFDFGELTTDSVSLDSSTLSFEHEDNKLVVQLPQSVEPNTKLSLTIVYHGKPKDGLILTTDKDGRPSAVGDNWPDRVHHWIPCLDHPSAKATVQFKITTPGNDLVVANGRLDHVETTSEGTRTWSYTEAQPIPPYCMVIGVGQFARIDGSSAITPLSFYVPQSDATYAPTGFAPAAPVLRVFTETVAPYPYEKLALIIGATRFGGMENSSAIVFASNLFNSSPSPSVSETFGIPAHTVDVVAHEIAHQWFGDSVTEATWSDLWLSEGFATYFAGVFIQRQEGETAFRRYMTEAAEKAFAYEKKKRAPIFDPNTENLFDLLNANNYQKGAWVLHMLRSRLGDDAFFSGIRNYYEAHKTSTATSEDLRSAFERASAADLKQFFQRWVYDSGHPQYELSWDWVKMKRALKVTLKQVQPGNAFLDPVELKITSASGSRVVKVEPTGKTFVQTIQLNERPQQVELDPRNLLLREIVSGNP
ncbi:MAG: hypothetical protein C5B55_10640 [Blastocatellia bacterium]|nr:MAG: hypothetical protein C5B55_10640 [Blastocatellia bacterium]